MRHVASPGLAQAQKGVSSLVSALLGGAGIREKARRDTEKELLGDYLQRAKARKTGAEADIVEAQSRALQQGLRSAYRQLGYEQPEALAILSRAQGLRFNPAQIGSFMGHRQQQRFLSQGVQAFRQNDPLLGNVLLSAGGRSPVELTRITGQGLAFNPLVPPDSQRIVPTELSRANVGAVRALERQRQAAAEASRAGRDAYRVLAMKRLMEILQPDSGNAPSGKGLKPYSAVLDRIFTKVATDQYGRPVTDPLTHKPVLVPDLARREAFLRWAREHGYRDLNQALLDWLAVEQSQQREAQPQPAPGDPQQWSDEALRQFLGLPLNAAP